MKNNFWMMLLIILSLLLLGCAGGPLSGPSSQLRIELELTPQQEISVGACANRRILQRLGGLYPDQDLAAYVSSIGQQLARHSQRPQLNYHFSIANDSSPTALALPGGFVLITRGLIAQLASETQLASILAREISHIVAGHSLQILRYNVRLTEHSLADLLTLEKGDTARQILETRVLTDAFLHVQYREDQQLETDLLSAELLAKTGYPLQNLSGADKKRFNVNTESLKETQEAYQLYDTAKKVEKDGAYGDAIEIYHRAMQKAPGHGLLLTGLGMAYLRNEDLVPARRYLLKAVRADSEYYRSHMGLGYVYLDSDQADQAVSHLQLSVDLLPVVEGVFLLADAHVLKGRVVRARELYQSVVEADRKGPLGQAAVERVKMLDQK